MKTRAMQNPIEGKTYNPNNEPWLTWLEANIEALILKQNYIQIMAQRFGAIGLQ